MLRAAIFAAGALVAGSAIAADQVSLLGVVVGAPFNLPACQVSRVTACAEETVSPPGAPDLGAKVFNVYLPAGSVPTFVKFDHIIVRVFDGNAESITMFTKGMESQVAVMRQLTDKFGSPTTVEQAAKQNGFGASFPYVHAVWKINGTEVELTGILNDVHTGVVHVESKRAIEMMVERFRALKKTEPKL